MSTGPSPAASVAVLGAMPEEVRPLVARLTGARRRRARGVRWHEGRLGDRRVLVAATGEGAGRAARVTAALLEVARVEALLGIGLAGALAPDLPRGALVVSAAVRAGAEAPCAAPPGWTTEAVRRLGARAGTLVSATALVATPAAKAALHHRLGPDALAVDLESAAWAGAAEARGVPWLVVRWVADAAGDALPPLLLRAQAADGRVRRGRVLLGAFLAPRHLRLLLALRRSVRRGGEALADAAVRVLAP